jgi:hypothetical protein
MIQTRVTISADEIKDIILELFTGLNSDYAIEVADIENIHVECECGKHINMNQLKLIVDLKAVGTLP